PVDCGFPIDVHAHEPDTIYVVPIDGEGGRIPPEGKLRVYRSRSGGNEWEPLTRGLPQADCYVNVLRDAMAVDSLDACGIYFGTTGGQVYCSPDGGDNWAPIARDLPGVLSVEVQTLKGRTGPRRSRPGGSGPPRPSAARGRGFGRSRDGSGRRRDPRIATVPPAHARERHGRRGGTRGRASGHAARRAR